MDGKVTFSTGTTVNIRRVPIMTMREVEASIPKPQPPIQKTDLGEEPNYSHPDYASALASYAQTLGQAMMDAMIIFGVDVDTEEPAIRAEIERVRALAKRAKLALPEDDLLCYIKHVAAASADDITALSKAISDLSMPADRRITEKMEALKSDVPGEGHTESAGAG